ncbi:hypothetical protein LCGC14_1058370 [marine sediment metagenome]|uniref:Uncharacterized protein n=1 Tax=marine sediment metagenome TaxID=412755 RepID=A0A0F9N8T6_9ZZZZ
MDWITTEYVKQEAEKGELAALECSLKHHKQGRDAGYVEFISIVTIGRYHVKDEFCACCVRFKDIHSHYCADGHSNSCPLFAESSNVHHCCNGLWSQLRDIFDAFKKDMSLDNFNKLKEAEAKVCTYIEGVLEKKRAEGKESDKSCPDCNHWHRKNRSCQECMGGSNFQPKSTKESPPALRHLDYGINDDGHIRLVIIERHSNNPIVWNKYGIGNPNGRDPKKDIWLGNLADDLARNAEDLDNYETTTKFNGSGVKLKIGVTVNPVDLIYFKVGGTYNGHQVHANIDEATEIHRKLGQLIATAIRKK